MQCIYASYYKLLCSGVGTAVTIWQIGILHIACKMSTIYCCIAIQILLNQPQEEQVYVQQVLKLQEG